MKKSIILSCLMACNIANCVDNGTYKSLIKDLYVPCVIFSCSVFTSYLFSIKYFKLGFDTRMPAYISEDLNLLLADINSVMLASGIAGLSGFARMKPIESKVYAAIGCIGTIAHFSYLIMKKRLIDRIIREELEEDYRNQERLLEEERSRNDRRLGTIRLPR